MEMYFNIKLISVGIFGFLFLIVVLYSIGNVILNRIKNKIMLKSGFIYDKGLGERVAYEYQPHYVHGNLRIRAKNINNMSFSEIKKWIKDNYK